MAEKINSIKIWVRAFIPGTILKSDGSEYTQTLTGPHYTGQKVIPGPILPTFVGYFLTDNRTFDSNEAASSRMHYAVTADILAGTLTETARRCDPSRKFRALNEDPIAEQAADASRIRFEGLQQTPWANGGKRITFRLRGEANNPLVPLSPDIDWDLGVQIEIDSGREIATFQLSGLIDPFPAHECYLSVNQRTPITVYSLSPLPDTDPWNLVGPPNRPVAPGPGSTGSSSISIDLGGKVAGNWRTNDTDQRFRLQFSGGNVTFIEKSGGSTLSRVVPYVHALGAYRIERSNNDVGLLSFLGFRPEVQQAIVATNPRPSFLTFYMDGGNLVSQWSGIQVTLNSNGTVNQIFQPGTRPSRPYTFVPA